MEAIPEQLPVTEGFVPGTSAQLWYWDTGGDGEPLVLCHPASQSSQIWLYQQPVFAKAGYRVIALSRRGHYRSERGPEGDPGTVIGDLRDLLAFLGIEKTHILGAAAGGISAVGFAVSHPERILSLVLAGTIVSPQEEEWREMYGRLGIAEIRSAATTEFLELGPSYRAADPAGVAKFVALEQEAKRNGPFAQPLGATVNWETMRRIHAPVLSITGDADLFVPPPLQRLIAAHLRNCELKTIAGVGHAAYWETPATFNDLVLDFLGGIPR